MGGVGSGRCQSGSMQTQVHVVAAVGNELVARERLRREGGASGTVTAPEEAKPAAASAVTTVVKTRSELRVGSQSAAAAAASLEVTGPVRTMLRIFHKAQVVHSRLALASLGVLPPHDRYGGTVPEGRPLPMVATALASPVLPPLAAVQAMLAEGILGVEELVELLHLAAKQLQLASMPPPLPLPSPPPAAATLKTAAGSPVRHSRQHFDIHSPGEDKGVEVAVAQGVQRALNTPEADTGEGSRAMVATEAATAAVDLILVLRRGLLGLLCKTRRTPEVVPLVASLRALQVRLHRFSQYLHALCQRCVQLGASPGWTMSVAQS